nr:immunoglobulin light chain junction region [Macaca mulatta]
EYYCQVYDSRINVLF